jgi:hypothetical protein
MNIIRRALVAGLALSATGAFAQSSATASANATARIIAPITLAQVTDLNFADVVSAAAGTVVLPPVGARSFTGGATAGSATGVAAASFTVGGQASATYAITLPAGTITITSGAGDIMTVGTFTSSPSGTGTLSGTGSQTLLVGGTLNVGASQPQGTYTGTFNVTVAYN